MHHKHALLGSGGIGMIDGLGKVTVGVREYVNRDAWSCVLSEGRWARA
jgi:hypothetical protein